MVRLQGQLQERRTFLIWSELARVLSVVLVAVVVAAVVVLCVYNSRQVLFKRFCWRRIGACRLPVTKNNVASQVLNRLRGCLGLSALQTGRAILLACNVCANC